MNKASADRSGYQFGTFKGVFTPSILTILGVVMYLRFGWVLGNVGLTGALVIATISTAITFMTGLSLSSLATNRRVEGGGAYYIISRSLGVEAGAAVGLPLFFAQALGISFYITGFSESLLSLFPGWPPMMVGIITLIVLTVVAYLSADIALRLQFVIMLMIVLSLVSFFTGSGSDITFPDVANIEKVGFWKVFAVFFPAVTGIEAGIAMSGDLKDPARALPRGTIGAIVIGYVVYTSVILFLNKIVPDTNSLRHESMSMIMMHTARWSRLVLLGVWAASLSSAMGSLLGAPRTLQALAKDRVIPSFIGKGFGKGNDPRIATVTAFLVALAGICLGDLNRIATILSMFFLTSYGLLNVSAGMEELTGTPSWRPKFRVPWWVSILGAFGCFAAMFMISAGATFIAAFVAFAVFFLMERRSLKARWGDIRSAVLMLLARNVIYKLAGHKPDERTWRPNILVMSGAPTSRWNLVELASAMSHERGFLAVAAIVPEDTTKERVEGISKTMSEYLDRRDVPALVKVYPSTSPLKGARELVGTYGYGPITPNTIILGVTERPENYLEFAELVKMVSRQKQNLVIVREGEIDESIDMNFERKRIVIWWYGTQQNLGLMLSLVYLLKRSRIWRDAELMLRTIVDKDAIVSEETQRLRSFIEKTRIDALAEVLKRSQTSIYNEIRDNSRDADFVFLGMRSPEKDEATEQYMMYYKNLLEQTRELPPSAFVMATENVDFYNIFRE